VRHQLLPSQNGHTVDVINAAKCNAKIRSGCRVIARARVGITPLAAAIDRRTDTVYVTNTPPLGSGTVSVIDGATCNGHTGRGCGHVPATVRVGTFPFAVAVDQASDTVYVSNSDNGFNGGRCRS
jgi:DNA-binding beta-propeller fold protein YncE